MDSFLSAKIVNSLPYNRVDYEIIQVPNGIENFIRAAAVFFVSNWMKSKLDDALKIFNAWDNATDEEKTEYRNYFDVALFTDGNLIDDPEKGFTYPMATFSETMLRWLRESYEPSQLMVEPSVPQPPGDGKIDLVEITGNCDDFSSLRVVLWEVKSSDHQVSEHNSKIYNQLSDYPKRFYHIANCMASNYTGTDPVLKKFLRDMAQMAYNRKPQVHYGAFVTYDTNVEQRISVAPKLHKYPSDHPKQSNEKCHNLIALLIPDFRNMRLSLWRALHFQPKE